MPVTYPEFVCSSAQSSPPSPNIQEPLRGSWPALTSRLNSLAHLQSIKAQTYMHISTRMKVFSLSSLMAEVCTPAATLCVWTRHPPPLARLRSLPGYYGYPAPIQRGAAAFACRRRSAAQVTVSSAREAALVRDGRLNVLYSLSAFSASLSRICFPSLSLSLFLSLSLWSFIVWCEFQSSAAAHCSEIAIHSSWSHLYLV